MAVLRLYWLGPPSIELDDRPVRLEMRKTLALLAYVSLSAHRPTRETLATLFWPEFDQQHALANLRRSLSSLARSLPSGLLEADRDTVGLRKLDQLWIDVDEFHQQLSFASQHSHPQKDVCPECIANLEHAVAIYRGNFFEGFSLKDCPEFDEWQFFQREGLLSKYAEAIEKLADYYGPHGMWEKAISCARSWVAVDRLNEPARRLLISLIAQSGQPWAARRQAEELSRILQEELGKKPDDETLDLFQSIQLETQEPHKKASKPLILEPSPACGLEPLLKTKLYIPFSKGEKVFREQVLSKLDQIQDHAFTILSAPAGYGKTTALSEWIKQCPLPVGWLSLDDADNHLVRFLTYLMAALQSVEAEIGGEVGAILQSPQPMSAQVIAASLIREFEKITGHFVLVLDDYQFIHEESIHAVLAALLDRLPGHTHLVISTRIDPPLSLARSRAQGKLLEIRVQDLRFTTEETLRFFNELMKLGISTKDLAILDERTEGWAVGLQMAALSLQKSPDISKAIQSFSGSNRYILDYLLEEVLERQPKIVKDFLLQTSILGALNGDLCDTVTKITEWSVDSDETVSGLQPPISSQQMLEYIERSNLFILSLDNERCWYRYHLLFAELLKARLEYFHPQWIQGLHQRASEWYEQNGLIPAAVRHGLASKSFDFAAGVIERAFGSNFIWSSGDLALALSWVDALPKEALIMHPLLRIYLCASLYVTGEFKKSVQILSDVEKSLPETLKTVPNPAHIQQMFLSFRILHEGTRGNISRAVEASASIQLLATGDELADLLGKNYLLLAYVVAGDVENALGTGRLSFEALSARGFAFQALSNAKNTADAYILQGRLTDAIDLCQEAIGRVKSSGESNPIAGILGFPIGAVLLERNELERAEKTVQESLELLAKGPLRNDFGQGYALLAMIKQAQGDRKGALHWIEYALRIAQTAEIPRIIHLIQGYQARIWLAQGEIDLASSWASAYQRIEPSEYPREIEDLTLAEVLIHQKQYALARDLLDSLLAKARAARRDGRAIEMLVLLSIVDALQDRSDQALDHLEGSLRSACREGYLRVYLEKGEPMQALLRLYHARRTAANKDFRAGETELFDYADRLLLAFEEGS